jgi:hypothetical protein
MDRMLPKTKSAVVEELQANPRRLNIAHACLGLLSMAVLWIRPGTVDPHWRFYGRYTILVRVVIHTALAWMPYVISLAVSRSLLTSRDPKATVFFIVIALAVTLVACGFYLGWFEKVATLSPIEISAGVTAVLAALAGLAAVIWQDDAPDRFLD